MIFQKLVWTEISIRLKMPSVYTNLLLYFQADVIAVGQFPTKRIRNDVMANTNGKLKS